MTLACVYLALQRRHLPGEAGLGGVGQSGKQAPGRLAFPTVLVSDLKDDSRGAWPAWLPALVERAALPG